MIEGEHVDTRLEEEEARKERGLRCLLNGPFVSFLAHQTHSTALNTIPPYYNDRGPHYRGPYCTHVGSASMPSRAAVIIKSAVAWFNNRLSRSRSPPLLHGTTLVCSTTTHRHASIGTTTITTSSSSLLPHPTPPLPSPTNPPAFHPHPSPNVHTPAQLCRPPHHPPSFYPRRPSARRVLPARSLCLGSNAGLRRPHERNPASPRHPPQDLYW